MLKRHPDGQPVPGAQVIVQCEQGLSATVENWRQTTDEAGRTPGKGGKTPLLLTETTHKATDHLDRPALRAYSYTLAVEAEGYAPVSMADIKPVESWQVVRVALPAFAESPIAQ